MRCSFPFKKEINGILYELPCGQCMACRLNIESDWANRILLEARSHDCNCFLTITYDNDHLPDNGSLVKRDIQLFLKRFRKQLGRKIRYYAAGEYGDQFGRPHYHLCVFGLSKMDQIFKDRIAQKNGYACRLDSWPQGACFVGDITLNSARYVAKYCLKKRKGKKSVEFYDQLGIIPEFALMSRRPGLAACFCDENSEELDHFKNIVIEGREYRLPVYFKNRLKVEIEKDSWKNYYELMKDKPKNITRKQWLELKGQQQENELRSKYGKN
jgi:hypothetical protein